MSVGIQVQVYGVKEALKEINKINPKLRREFTKRYKAIVKPVLDQAKGSFPDAPPLSRMGKPYKHLGAWDGGLVAKGVTARINTRGARKRNVEKGAVYETISTFLIQQKTGWGSLYDMAGKKMAVHKWQPTWLTKVLEVHHAQCGQPTNNTKRK